MRQHGHTAAKRGSRLQQEPQVAPAGAQRSAERAPHLSALCELGEGTGIGENNRIRPCWGDASTAVISGQAASTKGGESCELRAWKGKGNTPKCQKLGGASALCSTIWAF